MTESMLLATIIECAVGGFIIWGLFNEDRLVDFEDRFVDNVRILLQRRSAKRKMSMHREEA